MQSALTSDKLRRQVNTEWAAPTILKVSSDQGSHCSAVAWEAGVTAGLSEGGEVEGLQVWGWQGGVEQEAGGHTGLRNVAGWGTVVTAGRFQLPNSVWTGAGQADSTAAGFV
jgi:hypothetical protein